jgi:predicted nucleic acid-binding OB-fold protein
MRGVDAVRQAYQCGGGVPDVGRRTFDNLEVGSGGAVSGSNQAYGKNDTLEAVQYRRVHLAKIKPKHSLEIDDRLSIGPELTRSREKKNHKQTKSCIEYRIAKSVSRNKANKTKALRKHSILPGHL